MQIVDHTPDTQPRNALSFLLSGHACAIEIRSVLDIVRFDRVISAEDDALAIDLGGETIPVVDLRAQLDLPVPPASEETCVLIVERGTAVERERAGLVVDKVCDVILVNELIQNASGTTIPARFLVGFARLANANVPVLNAGTILHDLFSDSDSRILRAA